MEKSGFRSLVSINQQKQIHDALKRGSRIEIIPVKDGVRVMEVRRCEIK